MAIYQQSGRNGLLRMRIELDHLFVCTAPGAPEAEKFVEFGLIEGPPNHARIVPIEKVLRLLKASKKN